MSPTAVFVIQTIATVVIYGLVASWYLWPRLIRLPLASALIALLWIQTLGPAWFIPTYFVPALWVSHALVFILLVRGRRGAGAMRPA